MAQNFLKRALNRTAPYFLAGSLLINGCNDNQKTLSGRTVIVIPKLPSYEPKDYIFSGIIDGKYLQFYRDVSDEACNKNYYSKAVKSVNNQLEKIIGTEGFSKRLLLKDNVNVLIVRDPETGEETRFYDDKGAGENNDQGDLWADAYQGKDGILEKCGRLEQKEFANRLIDIYNFQNKRKIQTDKDKEKKNPKNSPDKGKTKKIWEAIRKIK